MAGIQAVASVSEASITTAAETLIQVVAAANHRVLIEEIDVSFQGISNTAAPILFQIVRQDDAGTSDALAPVKANASTDETLQTTARDNFSVEPSNDTAILFEKYIHPQGSFYWQARFCGEYAVGGGTRLGLKVKADAALTAGVSAWVRFEE